MEPEAAAAAAAGTVFAGALVMVFLAVTVLVAVAGFWGFVIYKAVQYANRKPGKPDIVAAEVVEPPRRA